MKTLPSNQENCVRLELTIKPSRIAFWKFILEGYDGLAVLSTLNAKEGYILLRFPACRRQEVKDLLNSLDDWAFM